MAKDEAEALMGKIKKIKQERKRAEVEAQIKKMKRNRLIIRFSVLFFFLALLSAGGFFGHRELNSRYQLDEKAVSFWNNLKTKKTEPKEEKVTRKTYTAAPAMQIDKEKTYLAKVETSKGNFTIALDAEHVPVTTNNFVVLARDGFYNQTVFHRIIKDFMIQGGDPRGDGTGGPGYKFADEQFSDDYTPGTVAMANSGPNTNGSQFFVMTGDYSNGKLPKNYTIFGNVTDGMDTIKKIAETKVTASASGENSKPTETVMIKKITIEEI